jgi:hypothetical protein
MLSLAVNASLSLLFSLVLILALFSDVRAIGEDKPITSWFTWMLPIAAGGSIIYSLILLVRMFGRFGYRASRNEMIVVGVMFAGLAMTGWLLTRRGFSTRRHILFLGLCWATVCLAWILPVRNFPLDGDRSDMLLNIVAAIRTWMTGGFPYQWHAVGTHRVPLPYLPVMWLLYIPFVVLGIDPRWMMLPAQLGLLVILWVALYRKLSVPWWAFIVWTALNPYLFIRHDMHVYALWTVVAATLLVMLRQRWIWAAVMWGILLAFRHTLWVPFPFFLVFLFWRVGWRTALLCGAIAAIVALFLLGPFVLTSPSGFLAGLEYQRSVGRDMPTATWSQVAGWTTGFSLVPLLWHAGFSGHAELMQLAIALIMFAIAVIRRPDLVATLQLMTITLLLFLLRNPQIEVYMYVEVVKSTNILTFQLGWHKVAVVSMIPQPSQGAVR